MEKENSVLRASTPVKTKLLSTPLSERKNIQPFLIYKDARKSLNFEASRRLSSYDKPLSSLKNDYDFQEQNLQLTKENFEEFSNLKKALERSKQENNLLEEKLSCLAKENFLFKNENYKLKNDISGMLLEKLQIENESQKLKRQDLLFKNKDDVHLMLVNLKQQLALAKEQISQKRSKICEDEKKIESLNQREADLLLQLANSKSEFEKYVEDHEIRCEYRKKTFQLQEKLLFLQKENEMKTQTLLVELEKYKSIEKELKEKLENLERRFATIQEEKESLEYRLSQSLAEASRFHNELNEANEERLMLQTENRVLQHSHCIDNNSLENLRGGLSKIIEALRFLQKEELSEVFLLKIYEELKTSLKNEENETTYELFKNTFETLQSFCKHVSNLSQKLTFVTENFNKEKEMKNNEIEILNSTIERLKTEKNNLWKENQKLEENVIRMEHLKKVYEKSKLEIDALQKTAEIHKQALATALSNLDTLQQRNNEKLMEKDGEILNWKSYSLQLESSLTEIREKEQVLGKNDPKFNSDFSILLKTPMKPLHGERTPFKTPLPIVGRL